ncbi:Metallophosphatase family protein [Spironucleus salmonicida]|nr:Metallophosphatase family protein [Spironucleus salmonicida]
MGCDTQSLRIIHSSDTHGWLWGDPHIPQINAGFAGILAFMRQQRILNPETFVFDSGDFIMGNGLSDADTDVPIGQFVYQMWDKALKADHYYDAITLGNHDLMLEDSLKYLLFKSDVATSSTTTNEWYKNEDKNPGERWRIIKNGNLTTLVAGFMYNFNSQDPLVVKDFKAVFDQDQKFKTLLQNEKPDFITILIHAGYHQHPENAYFMYQGIRQYTDCPVLVLGGHEHQTAYDYKISTALINGRLKWYHREVNTKWEGIFTDTYDKNFVYAETKNYFRALSLIDIQFESQKSPNGSKIIKSVKFTEQITNLDELAKLSNKQTKTFLNPFEQQLNSTIQAEVKRLDLLTVIGKAPMNYIMLNPNYLTDQSSIWNLWFTQMVPMILYPSGKLTNKTVHFLGTSFFPSDIVKGDVLKNDYYLTIPYTQEFFVIYRDVKAADLKLCFSQMNKKSAIEGFMKYFDLPVIITIEDSEILDVVCTDYDGTRLNAKFKEHSMEYTHESFGSLSPFDIYKQYVLQYFQ